MKTSECLFCESELKLIDIENDYHEGKALLCTNCGFQSPVCEDNEVAQNVYEDYYNNNVLYGEL